MMIQYMLNCIQYMWTWIPVTDTLCNCIPQLLIHYNKVTSLLFVHDRYADRHGLWLLFAVFNKTLQHSAVAVKLNMTARDKCKRHDSTRHVPGQEWFQLWEGVQPGRCSHSPDACPLRTQASPSPPIPDSPLAKENPPAPLRHLLEDSPSPTVKPLASELAPETS